MHNKTKILGFLFKISFLLILYNLKSTEAFSECRESTNSADPSILSIQNCLQLLAYYQSLGQSPQQWCTNLSNYQKCCLTCQNYQRLSSCNDIAYEPDCLVRARTNQCNVVLANNVPVFQYCQKSCGQCTQSAFVCSNLHINCNTGRCINTSFFSVQSISCICPADRGGTYCNLVNPCFFSNPCSNGGTCTPSYDFEATYTCTCAAGYTGANCGTLISGCSNFNCLNGGYCTVNAFSQPFCICPSGYSGIYCQNFVNPCLSIPCLNGATCVPIYSSVISYSCTCPSGYSGTNCGTLNFGCSSFNCLNGGYCTLNAFSQPYCICPSAYTGTYCQNFANPCSSNPCLNGGTCLPSFSNGVASFSCRCPSNCQGNCCQFCNSGCNSITCLNNGFCTLNAFGQPYCVCSAFFTGPNCQTSINPCFPNPCNSGQCTTLSSTDYRCTCPANSTGPNCNVAINFDLCSRGDLNPLNCAQWKAAGYCSYSILYQNVAVPVYCPISCGLCDGILTCSDSNTNCPYWANIGFCSFLIPNQPTLCRRSCGLCTTI